MEELVMGNKLNCCPNYACWFKSAEEQTVSGPLKGVTDQFAVAVYIKKSPAQTDGRRPISLCREELMLNHDPFADYAIGRLDL